ncbi:MAG: DNA helicase Rep [Wenzhouxiangellaceae bacterium]
MAQLNPQQEAAVRYSSGPLLVLAGAGSGKTRVITEKLIHLVRQVGVKPERIAAITFTNKAAKEMKARVGKRLKGDAKRFTVCTFHALGWRMLRRDPAALGYRPGLSLLDEQDSLGTLRDLLPGKTEKDDLVAVRQAISRCKNRALTPEQAAVAATSEAEMVAARAYARYQEQLQRLNAVDFDDLILGPLTLMQDDAQCQYWRDQWHYLLVDEYQDTNETQYQLLRRLAGPRGRITAVGDDDQSIYGWRGAQPENLAQLARDYPDLKIVKLEQNYRSTSKILRAANQVIAHNPHEFEKRLWSALGEGDDLRIIPCADEEEEARRVATEIAGQVQRGKLRLQDCAILYRGHHLSRAFERALREVNVRYHLSGGQSYFDRNEIRDVMAYLRMLVNPDDNSAFLRVVNTPRRGLGASTLGQLGDFATQRELSLFAAAWESEFLNALAQRQRQPLENFLRQLVEYGDRAQRGDAVAAIEDLLTAVDYRLYLEESADTPEQGERRITAINELIAWIKRLAEDEGPDATLADILAKLLMLGNLDDEDDAGEAVRLMTLHAAKGLEFPHVYLVALEEGVLPHHNSLAEGAEAEERRLMYVGVTRAQRVLTITYCRERKRRGGAESREPSRFLSELPRDGVYWYGADPNADKVRHEEAAKDHLAQLRAMFGGADGQ